MSKVKKSFQKIDPITFQQEIIKEMDMMEEWPLNEDLLSNSEAQKWLISDTELTLESGLSFFQEASAADSKAQIYSLKAAQLQGEAKELRKHGLEMILAASAKPSPSSLPSPSCTQTSTDSTDTSSPDPDTLASKKVKRASIPVTLDLSINLLDVHPLKIFHTVWCPDLQPQKIGQ